MLAKVGRLCYDKIKFFSPLRYHSGRPLVFYGKLYCDLYANQILLSGSTEG